MISTSYVVSGMTCAHCVQAVTTEVSALEGVSGVEVDLATGALVVRSAAPLDLSAVEEAVDEAGYTVAPAA